MVCIRSLRDSPSTLIAHISSRFPIIDLAVEEPEIEEIVRTIYRANQNLLTWKRNENLLAFIRQHFTCSIYRFNFFAQIFLILLRMYAIYGYGEFSTLKTGCIRRRLESNGHVRVMGMALECFMWSRPQNYMSRQVKSGCD